jgi:hypothetical protein
MSGLKMSRLRTVISPVWEHFLIWEEAVLIDDSVTQLLIEMNPIFRLALLASKPTLPSLEVLPLEIS